MPQQGICKLCKQDKALIDRSHIFPEFVYSNMYNQHHRLNEVIVDAETNQQQIRTLPQGLYEGGLLCRECDTQVIGQYESYASKFLNCNNFGRNERPAFTEAQIKGVEFLNCTNINYTKLKLFLLSLLWRADISSINNFKSVSLGPYREKIRNMIYSGDPSDDKDISIIILSWNNDNTAVPREYIFQPTRHKNNGKTHYVILLQGYMFVYYISPDNLLAQFENCRLKSDNTLKVLFLPKANTWDYLLNFL